MFEYDIAHWVLFFFIYCFLGWCIECMVVSVGQKKFVNRGFLRGPILPIYGSGALVILFFTLPVKFNPFLVYVCGLIGATLLEYVTGWIMETLLKTRYWDYTEENHNFQGRICLMSSLFWGALSIFLIYVVHDTVSMAVKSIPVQFLFWIDAAMCTAALVDMVFSVKTALDINKVLAGVTRIRSEIHELGESLADYIDDSEAVAVLRKRVESLKSEYLEQYDRLSNMASSFIKAHPSSRSKYFNEALAEIKAKLNVRNLRQIRQELKEEFIDRFIHK